MHAINSGARLVSLLRHFPFPRRALDLGCGSDSDLATCLISLGSERQLAHFVTVHIVSLDLQFPALRSIQRKANIHELVLISSVQANLDHLPFSRHVAFDLILIRHPDIDRMRTSWKRALEVAPGLLGSTGIVLITTYSTA